MTRRAQSLLLIALLLACPLARAQAASAEVLRGRLTVAGATAGQVRELCAQAAAEGVAVNVAQRGGAVVLELSADSGSAVSAAMAKLSKAARSAGLAVEFVQLHVASDDAIAGSAGTAVKALSPAEAPAAIHAVVEAVPDATPPAGQERSQPARPILELIPHADGVRGPPAI